MSKTPKTKKIEKDREYLNKETGEIIKGRDLIDNLEKLPTLDEELDEIQQVEKNQNKPKEVYIADNYIKQYFGEYYHLLYGNLAEGVEANYIVRLMYLACYMDYDTGVLISKPNGFNKRNMLERDIRIVLGLSPREYTNTKNYLIENKYLTIEKNRITINTKYCIKGKLNTKGLKTIEECVSRVFTHGFKYVYQACMPKDHKKLFMLIKLLPFMSLKYNIIAKNPLEENLDEIEFLLDKDIANLMNMSLKGFKMAINSLSNVKIGGTPIIGKYEDYRGAKYIINPKILYCGNNEEDIKIIDKLMNG